MAIYKLGELFEFPSTAIQINEESKSSHGIQYFRGTELSYKTSPIHIDITKLPKTIDQKKHLTIKNDILVQKIRYIKIKYTLEPVMHNASVINFRPRSDFNGKYLYMKLQSLTSFIQDRYFHSGTKMPQLHLKSLKNIKLDIPSLSIQKEIIDIIEPVDDAINLIILIEKKLQSLINKLSMDSNTQSSLMNESSSFIKGSLPIKGEKGNTPFLNVAAANGRVNTYVANEPNIKKGDITLSLDGTCGLVNNMLEGFNGYLYKIESKKYEDYELYYSLLNKENQDIIKKFSFGTTIKHASRAIKYLKVFSLPKELNEIYELEKLIKFVLYCLEEIRTRMLEYLL